MKRGFVITALLLVAACSPPGAIRGDAPEQANGFVVGEVYVVTSPLKAVTWGEQTSLVPEMRLSKDAAKPAAIHDIDVGTQIRITAIRQHNTLTHGMETWPEGVVTDGPMKGMTVSLKNPDLRDRMQGTTQ